MAISVVYQAAATTKTSGNTITTSWPTSTVLAGDVIVVVSFADNVTATTPTVSSMSKPASETASWTDLGYTGSPSASAGAAVIGEVWIMQTTVNWSTAVLGSGITITISDTVAARGYLCWVLRGAGSTLVGTLRTSANSGTDPSFGLSSATMGVDPTSGNILFSALACENSAAMTPPSSTTGGTWDSNGGNMLRNTTGGGAASNLSIGGVSKILTATGSQTAAWTGTNGEYAHIALQLGQAASGVPDTPSTAPTVAARTDGGVNVTLPALSTSTNATSWKLYRDSTEIATAQSGGAVYADTAASPVATQTYKVKGTNTNGDSASFSPVSSAIVGNPTAPVPALTPGGSKVTITFSSLAYDRVYRVYRGPSGGSRTLVHTSSTITSGNTYQYEDTGLTNGNTYDYSFSMEVFTPTQRTSTQGSVQSATPNSMSSGPSLPSGRRLAYINDMGDGKIYVANGEEWFQDVNGDWRALDSAYTWTPGAGSWVAKNTVSATFSSSDDQHMTVGANYRWSGLNQNIYKYNLTTDAWDLCTTEQFPSTGSGFATYEMTGIRLSNTDYYMMAMSAPAFTDYRFYHWNPTTNTWTEKASPGTISTGTWDQYHYSSGKLMTDGSQVFLYNGNSGLARYVPASNTWHEVEPRTSFHADLAEAAEAAGTGVLSDPVMVDGCIYFLGAGHTQQDPSLNDPNVYRYVVATDTWSIVATNLPSPYAHMNITVSNGVIYAVGGAQHWDTFSGGDSSDTRVYDPPAIDSYLGVIGGTTGLTGSGTLTLAGEMLGEHYSGSIGLSGSGTLSLTSGLVTVSGVVATTGAGQLSLAAVVGVSGSCALTGVGTLTGAAAASLLPPANLTVTIISPTQLDISWDAATGATGYDLERNGVIISEYQPGLTYSDTGLTQGVTYTYRVRSQKVES